MPQQTCPAKQQEPSQHSRAAGQHASPQHASVPPQHVLPQQWPDAQQVPPQHSSPLPQQAEPQTSAEGQQEPPTHASPAAQHVLPQQVVAQQLAPQHAELHGVPPQQNAALIPHPPQFAGLNRSWQVPEQQPKRAPGGEQSPGQQAPQAPQFRSLAARSTQVPAQHPGVTPAQTFPHVLQLRASHCRSKPSSVAVSQSSSPPLQTSTLPPVASEHPVAASEAHSITPSSHESVSAPSQGTPRPKPSSVAVSQLSSTPLHRSG